MKQSRERARIGDVPEEYENTKREGIYQIKIFRDNEVKLIECRKGEDGKGENEEEVSISGTSGQREI